MQAEPNQRAHFVPISLLHAHHQSGVPSDFAPVPGGSLSRLLDGQPAKQVSIFEWWRWKWCNMPRTRFVIETGNGLISAISAGVYVYDTYTPITNIARIVYFIASWTILVEYVCKLFASNDFIKYILWSMALIDAATIGFGFAYFWDTQGVNNSVSFIRALRMLQVVRFFRALTQQFFTWLRGSVHPSQLELYRHLFDLIIVVGMVVFVGGCAFYELETINLLTDEVVAPAYLHEGIYWACVTLTTVGYGDFAPSNVVTQMLFPVMIAILLVIVPSKVSALTSSMDSITPSMRRGHIPHRFGEHIVLMGHSNHKTMKTFVDEFYAQEHVQKEMQLVLLRPDPPGPDMRVMMASHEAHRRMEYLQGSPFVVEDLYRTGLTRALAVFVMCNKYAQDVEEEDTRTLLTVLALSQFIRQNTNKRRARWNIMKGGRKEHVQGWGSEAWKQHAAKWMASSKSKDEVPHIIVQFHLPETIQRARQLLDSQASHPLELGLLPVGSTLFPMCLGSIKHAMIGASLHTPGLLTLMSNLTMSCAISGTFVPGNSDWLSEYLSGACNEVYEVHLPDQVQGMTYVQAVTWLFDVHGAILLGLRLNMSELNDPERYNVHLAPFNAEGLLVDVVIMMGIILSQDDNFNGSSPEPGQGVEPMDPQPGPTKGKPVDSSMVVSGLQVNPAGETWASMTSVQLCDNPEYQNGQTRTSKTMGQPVAEGARGWQDSAHAPLLVHLPGVSQQQQQQGVQVLSMSSHTCALPHQQQQQQQGLQRYQQQVEQQPQQQQQQQQGQRTVAGELKISASLSTSSATSEMAGLFSQLGSMHSQGGTGSGSSSSRRGPLGPVCEGTEQGDVWLQGEVEVDSLRREGAEQQGEVEVDSLRCEGTEQQGEVEVDSLRREGAEQQGGGLSGAAAEGGPQASTPPHVLAEVSNLGSMNKLSLEMASPPCKHYKEHQLQNSKSTPPPPDTHPPDCKDSSVTPSPMITSPPVQRQPQPSLPPESVLPRQASYDNVTAIPSSLANSMFHKDLSAPGHNDGSASQSQHSHKSDDSSSWCAEAQPLNQAKVLFNVHANSVAPAQKQGTHQIAPAPSPLANSSRTHHLKVPQARPHRDLHQLAFNAQCGSISEQATLMQRFAKTNYTLKLIDNCKQLETPGARRGIVIIAGNSCFHYLHDLVAAIRGVKRSPLASAVKLARKQTQGLQQAAQREQGESPLCNRPSMESSTTQPTRTMTSAYNTPFAHVPFSPVCCKTARHARKMGDQERAFSQCPIVILDPVGPNASQVMGLTELENVFLLLGSPANPKDLGRLQLTSGSHVRALVLPCIKYLDEQAVLGSEMSEADAHTLSACSNLRQYCNLAGANLEILTEALSVVYVSYLLPMCISGPPYDRREEEVYEKEENMGSLATLIKMGTRACSGTLSPRPTSQLTNMFSMSKPAASASEQEGTRLVSGGAVCIPLQPSSAVPGNPHHKSKHKQFNSLKLSLKSSVPVYKLPSQIKSLAPKVQKSQKVEESVARLLLNNPALAPALATGHIFSVAMMDKLFCMILFNPLLIQIVTKMLGVWETVEVKEQDLDMLPTAISLMAQGLTLEDDLNEKESNPGQDELLQQDVRKLQLAHEKAQGKKQKQHASEHPDKSTDDGHAHTGHMHTDHHENESPSVVDAAPRIHVLSVCCFEGQRGLPKTWYELFKSWTVQRLLPIGLYRKDPETEFPYVYTSPAKETPLRATDMVYVLAARNDLP